MPVFELPPADWYEKAARDIAQQGITLFQWANVNDRGLTRKDCEAIAKDYRFQQILRSERNKVFKDLANDPQRGRTTAVGQLLFIINKLIDAEQFDKATNAIAQLFKVEGWSNEQTQVNVFNDLKSNDLEALRARVAKKKGIQPIQKLD